MRSTGVPSVNLKKCLGWHFELERHGNGLSESIELFSVCYGESVEQYVALHKGCARNRASISSSASVFLHMVETQREDLKDDFVQNFHPVFFFAFSFHIRS